MNKKATTSEFINNFHEQSASLFLILLLLTDLAFIALHTIEYLASSLYLLLDDALEIHESVGALITGNLTLTPPFGLRLRDLGELAVAGTVGVVLLLLVLSADLYGSKAFRKMSLDMLLLMLILAFFGVIVDTVHVIAYMSSQIGWKVSAVLAVIEDGGEMFVASLILWYVFLLCMRDKNHTLSFFDFGYKILTRRST